ncbi:MAG: hypothetical protein KAS61_07505 [Spirochaetes bacterium]|nr:hypothetical protein [Spirochaetota bacterium]
MFRRFLLLAIEGVIVIVEWSVAGIMLVRDYGIRVWQNNVMRKWVFEIMDHVDARFHRFVAYLKEIETLLQCRIVYAKITKPMKFHYRELSRRRLP